MTTKACSSNNQNGRKAMQCAKHARGEERQFCKAKLHSFVWIVLWPLGIQMEIAGCKFIHDLRFETNEKMLIALVSITINTCLTRP